MSDTPRAPSATPPLNAGYPPSSPRRIAVVHDWLDTFAGSERVLEQILLCYPTADLFVVVDFLAPEHRHILQGIVPQPSMIQRLPMARKRFRAYLPLMPLAVEQFDVALVVEDALVVVDGHAIITRPGAPSRRGETDSIEPVVAALGLPMHRIADPATVDGGDVLVTDRHVFIGMSTRSNAASVEQFDRIVRPLGRRAIGVVVTGCLHLKSAITCLPDGSLIAVPGWVDQRQFTDHGYVVHDAAETTGGDVLCLGETVVLPADAPLTAARIDRLGFRAEPIDVGELQKIEAGVTCMSVLV